jgi:hypothetical protein
MLFKLCGDPTLAWFGIWLPPQFCNEPFRTEERTLCDDKPSLPGLSIQIESYASKMKCCAVGLISAVLDISTWVHIRPASVELGHQ